MILQWSKVDVFQIEIIRFRLLAPEHSLHHDKKEQKKKNCH